jgi:hypothetical protein
VRDALALVSQQTHAVATTFFAAFFLSAALQVDFKLIVQVRPFGFAPFVVSGITCAALCLKLYVWAKKGFE